MPYVRQRGNHLAIVHGARHPTTKKVEQQVLFTLHSKAEALAAIGKAPNDPGSKRLLGLLQRRYPGIHFDWEEISRSLDEMKACLPDDVPTRESHVFRDFRENLLGFARQLAFADPQSLTSARELLVVQRVELDWVAELIRWRLDILDRCRDNEFTRDSFGWALALRRQDVPPEMEEMAAASWEKGDLERAEKIFELLVDAFPSYAEGWNYLGLIALRRGEHEAAIERFERTIRIGRTLFPQRIPKKDYWRNLETRPYMRGLRNVTLAFIRAGQYDAALAAAQRLETECGDRETAQDRRVLVFLNRREFRLVLDEFGKSREHSSSDALLVCLAAIELGEVDLARRELVRAILGATRTSAIVLGFRSSEPRAYLSVHDHNEGVELHASLTSCLATRSAKSKRFVRELWQHPLIDSLRRELETLERKLDAARGNDRSAFDRLHEIRSITFAEKTTKRLADEQKKGTT